METSDLFKWFSSFFAAAFFLVLVYLLLTKGSQLNTIMNGFAKSSSLIFSTLQGNQVGGLANVTPIGGNIYG